jgi:tight adherence protein B
MLGVLLLVFVGVFALVALPLIALTLEPARQAKQAMATLDSALADEHTVSQDQIVNLRKDASLSSIPWLNRKLQEFDLGPWVHGRLRQANLDWSAGRLLAACGACVVVPGYLAYLRFHSAPLAMLLGVVVGAIPLGYVHFKRKQRFDKFERMLPEAIDLMVSGLRAGHSLIAAMGLVAREVADPVGGEFRICFEEQNYGLELKTALTNLLERMPLQDLRIVTTAILIQKESGGNLAEVLDKAGHAIRERFRLKRQVQVHTAQGRLTGWILTGLPIVLGVALYFANPEMMSLLWTRPIGLKLMWVASGMIVVGGFLIHHIVSMDV